MTTKPGEGRPNEEILVEMVLPLQTLMEKIVGETHSLAALRGVFALVHGYVMLELNQQLQRGGDFDETFKLVTEAYLRGWAHVPHV
ncbi:MAG: TetR-like C-terminal domain-containing protein [Chloroflexota bacterium]